MTTGWEEPDRLAPAPISGVELYQRRRQQLSERFPGLLVVVPSGVGQTRSNDTEYRFRPSTDFLYLVGEGEPDEVLVLEPQPEGGHLAHLYAEPEADFTKSEFFTDRVKGVFWVGPRRGLAASSTRFGVEAKPLADLKPLVSAHDRGVVLRGVDPRVDHLTQDLAGPDQELATHLSEMRIVKDGLEVDPLQEAVDITRQAFEDVVRVLPQSHHERDVEVAFFKRARTMGNDTGYNTADITRTVPINGHFSPAQRKIYELVWQAQQAGFAEVKPGADFRAPNKAAQAVLAKGLEELGILPISAEQSLQSDSQLHQRYTLHTVSHMLGLDVHDCAHSRQEVYPEGNLKVGMVLTVEPGLYFQLHDATVPAELRGIGVRIEDDVVVTENGCRILSSGIPSHPDEVEKWMAKLWEADRD